VQINGGTKMIVVEQNGPVVKIVISNPDKYNRLTTDDMEDMTLRLREINSNSKIKVAVITGQGDKAFCTGADLGEFQESSILYHRKRNEMYRNLCATLYEIKKPLIARVNGTAVAGGMAMVTLAHFAIASEHAKFGTPEINVGAFPSMVMVGIFKTIPRKTAMKMVLLGENLTAQQALEAGLVNSVVPFDELDQSVMELAEKLASKSSAIMNFGLDAIRVSDDMPYLTALEYLQETATMIRCTEDCQEGVRAFLERRKPVWKGR
jgi:enoyl-CoA hydratase/carnithine racemase